MILFSLQALEAETLREVVITTSEQWLRVGGAGERLRDDETERCVFKQRGGPHVAHRRQRGRVHHESLRSPLALAGM